MTNADEMLDDYRGRSPRWWAVFVLHNCVIHPLLPVGALASLVGGPGQHLADAIWWLDDHTVPDEGLRG